MAAVTDAMNFVVAINASLVREVVVPGTTPIAEGLQDCPRLGQGAATAPASMRGDQEFPGRSGPGAGDGALAVGAVSAC